MKLPFDHIIITSDERLGKMHHTQVLFADYLSKENRVVFINPPRAWKPGNLINTPENPSPVKKIVVLEYWNRFPNLFKIFGRLNEEINEKRLLSYLKHQSTATALIWHFDSYRSLLNGQAFSKNINITHLYHVIDPYHKNPIDRMLRNVADLIVITSPRLAPFYSTHQKKVITLPQAVDLSLDRDLLNGPLPGKFNISTPYVVLIGTFSIDIDYEWLRGLVSQDKLTLVLIGRVIEEPSNVAEFQSLIKLERVEYLGEMTPREFYPVLKGARAGLIVYNHRRRNAIFSPLKVLNYLVAFIPVISNADCEIPSLTGKAIYITPTIAEFIETVKSTDKLLIEPAEVDAYLKSVSIEKLVNHIRDQLTNLRPNP